MTDTALLHSKEFEIEDGGERIIIAEAPCRLHILGDHGQIDYGFFLSCTGDRSVTVALSQRKDSSLRFFSAELGERKRSSLANLRYKREDRWANYCKVALFIFGELGFPLKGMNFTISSDVPRNISLAASSSIEVASALALRKFFGATLSDEDLIEHLAKVHREFFPEQNSLVDYLAIINAKKDHFLMIDEETRSVKRIKNPFAKCKILLLDSKVPSIDVETELRGRRNALTNGAKILSNDGMIRSLKLFSKSDLDELMGSLNEEVRRRCLFVIQEHERIALAVKALQTGDKEGFSKLLYHSHEGLRDLYEVSCPEIDWLVKRAQEIPNAVGARMTGSGFGGCVYVIIPSNLAEEYNSRMDDYERIFGFRPVTYEIRTAGSAKLLTK
ncbi:MAG: galactokinase [Termitinemataceae bacterium]|nr:MAG: galactokinase [Termitinemataceae bacterium]